MQIDGHFSKWLEKSALLNHYYIETRYPADIPFDIDTDTVMELIHSSSEMLSFITEIIHFDFRSYRKNKSGLLSCKINIDKGFIKSKRA